MHGKLTQDHDGLRVAMREFAQLIDGAALTDMPEVTRRRISFSQRFRAHMAAEDAVLRDLKRRVASPEIDRTVREHSRAQVDLFLRYSDHIERWTPAAITADLAGYAMAVQALQKGLYALMDWEETHLHPLLVQWQEQPQRRCA